MLFTWIYMSRAQRAYDVAELDVMCSQFAARNDKAGVTGVLMKVGDHFVQVLEGEESTLLALVAKLLKDERHGDFHTLHRGPISERRFAKWSMRMMHLDRSYTVKAPAIAELRKIVRTVLSSQAFSDPELQRGAVVRLLMAIPRVIALDGNSEAGAVRSARDVVELPVVPPPLPASLLPVRPVPPVR